MRDQIFLLFFTAGTAKSQKIKITGFDDPGIAFLRFQLYELGHLPVRQQNIFHDPTATADKMLVICSIGIKMFGPIDPPDPPDRTVLRQEVQVSVNRSQTDAGDCFPEIPIYGVSSRVVFPVT